MPAEAWTALAMAMRAGHIARLKEAQRYVREPWGIASHSRNGLSQLFTRHRTTLKTGRRRPRRADPVAQAACKQSRRPRPRPAARATRVGPS